MATDLLTAATTIQASAEAIFAMLADPKTHAAINGTGRVVAPVDTDPITASGRVFRMAMYHPNHPNGNYEIHNQVTVFEPPRAIGWKPGYDTGDGSLGFGGWTWRYDLVPLGPAATGVTLTYDWSAVPDAVREHVGFPPFAPDPPFSAADLSQSLAHLAELVAS